MKRKSSVVVMALGLGAATWVGGCGSNPFKRNDTSKDEPTAMLPATPVPQPEGGKVAQDQKSQNETKAGGVQTNAQADEDPANVDDRFARGRLRR